MLNKFRRSGNVLPSGAGAVVFRPEPRIMSNQTFKNCSGAASSSASTSASSATGLSFASTSATPLTTSVLSSSSLYGRDSLSSAAHDPPASRKPSCTMSSTLGEMKPASSSWSLENKTEVAGENKLNFDEERDSNFIRPKAARHSPGSYVLSDVGGVPGPRISVSSSSAQSFISSDHTSTRRRNTGDMSKHERAETRPAVAPASGSGSRAAPSPLDQFLSGSEAGGATTPIQPLNFSSTSELDQNTRKSSGGVVPPVAASTTLLNTRKVKISGSRSSRLGSLEHDQFTDHHLEGGGGGRANVDSHNDQHQQTSLNLLGVVPASSSSSRKVSSDNTTTEKLYQRPSPSAASNKAAAESMMFNTSAPISNVEVKHHGAHDVDEEDVEHDKLAVAQKQQLIHDPRRRQAQGCESESVLSDHLARHSMVHRGGTGQHDSKDEEPAPHRRHRKSSKEKKSRKSSRTSEMNTKADDHELLLAEETTTQAEKPRKRTSSRAEKKKKKKSSSSKERSGTEHSVASTPVAGVQQPNDQEENGFKNHIAATSFPSFEDFGSKIFDMIPRIKTTVAKKLQQEGEEEQHLFQSRSCEEQNGRDGYNINSGPSTSSHDTAASSTSSGERRGTTDVERGTSSFAHIMDSSATSTTASASISSSGGAPAPPPGTSLISTALPLRTIATTVKKARQQELLLQDPKSCTTTSRGRGEQAPVEKKIRLNSGSEGEKAASAGTTAAAGAAKTTMLNSGRADESRKGHLQTKLDDHSADAAEQRKQALLNYF
ncbi:unnamed protein product [Amoebophrya sp. A120]|nr:unnamed protein product [Amoebophrya sp. A120]|eukprot:GSA120T00023950001.1